MKQKKHGAVHRKEVIESTGDRPEENKKIWETERKRNKNETKKKRMKKKERDKGGN